MIRSGWMKTIGLAFLASGLIFVGIAPSRANDSDCLECHSQEKLDPVNSTRTPEELHVGKDALRGSVHEDLSCTDCHKEAAGAKPHYEQGGTPPALQCAACHEQAQKDYETSDIHGRRHKESVHRAPWCNDCHGSHRILPLKSPDSALSVLNQPELCGKCHGTDELNDGSGGIMKRKLLERYYSSVHWRSIKEGMPAATCSACHGHHTILPSSDPESRVTRYGLLKTCAKCHSAEVEGFTRGSHGRTLLRGNNDVPTCTTCHGDHDIITLKVQSSGKRDYAATQICIWCHGNDRMMSRYALDTSPVESYMRDFHGLTQRGSLGASATCADCHDAHYSLPSSHPDSRMNISNRGTTCGKCHGQASDSFIMSFTHKSSQTANDRGRIVQIVKIIYILLIAVVVGGMLLHNFIVWSFFVRRKLRHQNANGTAVRLNRLERNWHLWLLVSFSLLGATGFALSFPESPLFKWLYELGMTEEIRGWIHRAAALLMLADMLLFLIYKSVSKWGRRFWREMMPRVSDLREFVGAMKYYLTGRGSAPRFGVFNYAEKAEYWALWWGIFVMALTGFVLWFSSMLPEDSPVWLIDLARTIHFYEAVLAVSSIVVWHLFHVVFHPEEYPLNTTFLTGRLTEREARHRFTDAAVEAQVPPSPPPSDLDRPLDTPEWLRDTPLSRSDEKTDTPDRPSETGAKKTS